MPTVPSHLTYDQARNDPGYREMRATDIINFDRAREHLGRDLTDAEAWAIYENKQDQMLVDMGR